MLDFCEPVNITGTMFVRNTSAPVDLPKGKKMIMMVGVMLVDDSFPIKDEHLVGIRGQSGRQHIDLEIHSSNQHPVPDEYANSGIDRLLLSPIWRA